MKRTRANMSAPPPTMEAMEPRRLLAAAALEPGDVHVQFNFQPETSTTVPPGYRADIGRAYGRRANGLTYGWSASNEIDAVNRDHPNSIDERFDTFIGMGDQSWSIEVPNGTYNVYVAMGDPVVTGARFGITVEGVPSVSGSPTAQEPWLGQTVTVTVSDGVLTIARAKGSRNNKLAMVQIESTPARPAGGLGIDWTRRNAPRAPIGRVDQAGVQVGHKLYFIGGYDTVDLGVTSRLDIFDLKKEQWTRGASLLDGAARTHAGAATDGRYIYLISGQPGPQWSEPTRSSWRYDPVTDSWDSYVALPEARYGGALAYLNGILYFFGGAKPDRATPAADHWALNTRSDNPSWVRRAPLPVAADHLAPMVVNGVIYAIGGEHGHAGLNNNPPGTYDQHADVFAYDARRDRWSRRSSMPIASSHFEWSTVQVGRYIITLSGMEGREEFSNAVLAYDTVADTWTELDPLPDAREGPAAGVYNGRIFFAAGYSNEQGLSTRTYWGTIRIG